jgi:protein-disulfide isomerase
VKAKLLIIGIALMSLATVYLIATKLYRSEESAKLEGMAKADLARFVPEHAPRLGTSSPKVYLVEFLDPECESCREFYPFVKSLLKDYDGKLQLVVRYAPFHPNSRLAIRILEASRRQGKYWETLETLFKHQPQWGSHHNPQPELLWKILPEAGLDVEMIKADILDPEIDKNIGKDVEDLTALGVRGTPTFFVNGKPLEVFGYGPLRELIERELKAAETATP